MSDKLAEGAARWCAARVELSDILPYTVCQRADPMNWADNIGAPPCYVKNDGPWCDGCKERADQLFRIKELKAEIRRAKAQMMRAYKKSVGRIK